MNVSASAQRSENKDQPINPSEIKLNVLFAPNFQNTNPYQKQLSQALAARGVQVDGLASSQNLLSLLKRKNLEILHLHWLYPFYQTASPKVSLLKLAQFVVGLLVLRLRGVKVVWTAHNLKSHEPISPRLDHWCTTLVAQWSDAIIAHCEVAKAEAAAAFGIRNLDKIVVMPHGNYANYYENQIDQTAARTSLGLDPEKLVFLFLGMIRPYKGILELIDIFAQLQRQDVQLVLAGKPLNAGITAEIQEKIANQPLIRFIPGFVPDAEIQVYMNACDAVIFPYRDILTSGSVILAMTFGKACVAPRMGCIGEILNGSGAFLYDPQAPEGLSQAIDQAIAARAALPNMGKYNRQQADQWTWDLVADMTLEAYQSCLRT